MNRTALGFLLVCSFLVLGCGSGPIVIDVDVPIDQDSPYDPNQPNTLTTATGATVFFQFDALQPNPQNINALAGEATIMFPTSSGGFFDATGKEFDLSAAPLDKNKLYRVTMVGLVDTSGTQKYRGFGDCPLLKRLGEKNLIVVCFGLAGSNPVCADTRDFSQCQLN